MSSVGMGMAGSYVGMGCSVGDASVAGVPRAAVGVTDADGVGWPGAFVGLGPPGIIGP